MNKMYLVMGDWSGDGHEKYDKILLESNCEIGEIKAAYKAACRLTGVQFNDNENYTNEKYPIKIATDYEEPYIPVEALEIFREKFGLTNEIIQSWDKEDDFEFEEDEPIALTTESFPHAWIWFVKLANPNIQLKVADAKDKIPCINGFWDKKLNVSFGYGLYN